MTMFDGTPVFSAFPIFVESKALVMSTCPAELAAWRTAVATHKSMPSAEAKLTFRPKLEKAWKGLKAAYESAMSMPATMAA